MSQFVNRQMLSHKKVTNYPSVLFLTTRGKGQGLRVINGISALLRCRLHQRTPSARRASPAPRKRSAWRIYGPAKLLTFHFCTGGCTVTANMAASHYPDPRSMSRSSHYCTMHQSVHINVLPLSYLAVCRRKTVGVWASAESLFVCLHCWLGVITPSLILVVIQLCVLCCRHEMWGLWFALPGHLACRSSESDSFVL